MIEYFKTNIVVRFFFTFTPQKQQHNMSVLTLAIIFTLGMLFLILEILVFPGTGIPGIVGFILLGLTVWQVYDIYGSTIGHITLAVAVIISSVALWYALRPNTWRKVALHSTIDGSAVADLASINAGDEGVTISRLAPMGKARIGDKIVEVKSLSTLIDEKVKIRVLKVENNAIYVEKI